MVTVPCARPHTHKSADRIIADLERRMLGLCCPQLLQSPRPVCHAPCTCVLHDVCQAACRWARDHAAIAANMRCTQLLEGRCRRLRRRTTAQPAATWQPTRYDPMPAPAAHTVRARRGLATRSCSPPGRCRIRRQPRTWRPEPAGDRTAGGATPLRRMDTQNPRRAASTIRSPHQQSRRCWASKVRGETLVAAAELVDAVAMVAMRGRPAAPKVVATASRSRTARRRHAPHRNCSQCGRCHTPRRPRSDRRRCGCLGNSAAP